MSDLYAGKEGPNMAALKSYLLQVDTVARQSGVPLLDDRKVQGLGNVGCGTL